MNQKKEVNNVATDYLTDVTDEMKFVGAGLSQRLVIPQSFLTKTRPLSSN